MSDPRKIEQVAKQCDAVAHMAMALAGVHQAKAKMVRSNPQFAAIAWVGQHTANLMETLGDILNGMDAVDPDQDAWIDPIIEEAQRLWPSRDRR